ncbi:MAG: hypothetical protein APR63_14685 [Desulfuromonas sp. SDB]|nr:MAG: hypothetical protein APR63_14685 [Desulfuromonas sp. SDB]
MTDQQNQMSFIQKMITAILFPFAESIQKESREWKVTCECGYSKSIWEYGGIRWKAKGEPKKLIKCPACGKMTWHRIHHMPESIE